MSADNLTPASRSFYERVRFKMTAAIFLGGMACTSLAYCATYGGQSNSANFSKNLANKNTDDSVYESYVALVGGYGFGSFMFFVAFAVFLAGAVYASPMLCGSANEKRLADKPQEIEGGTYGYAGSDHGQAKNPLAQDEV